MFINKTSCQLVSLDFQLPTNTKAKIYLLMGMAKAYSVDGLKPLDIVTIPTAVNGTK
jgi:hypothetical protein